MNADFNIAVEYTICNEGGYTDNDSAGPTNWGITLTTLTRWRALRVHIGPPVTAEDVKALTQIEAKAIYKTFWWEVMGLAGVTRQEIATAIFDIGVNDGPATALKLAQRAIGVHPDGIMGSTTLATLNYVDTYKFLFAYLDGVQDHYAGIVEASPQKARFLRGWMRRSRAMIRLWSIP